MATKKSTKGKTKKPKKKNLLSIQNDYVFKKVFENLEVLADFLSSYFLVLITPKNIVIDNTFVQPVEVNGKLIILDLKFKLIFDNIILGFFDIEMQLSINEFIWNRFQYYTSKINVDQIDSGEKYYQLKKSFCLALLGRNLINDEYCQHKFILYDKKHNVTFENSMEIHTIEINKKDNFFKDMTDEEKNKYKKLCNWINFFSCKNEEEYIKAAKTDPMINKAWEIVWRLSMNNRDREIAEAVDKLRGDELANFHAGLNQGLNQGLNKGRKEGIEQRNREIAADMLLDNRPIEEIQKYTRLNVDRINEIKASLSL